MNLFASGNPEQVAAIMVTGGIFLLWYWSILGHRQLATSVYGELVRSRNLAATCGLGLCFVAAGSTLWLTNAMFFAAAMTVAAILVQAALEPSRESFWHHHRIRMIGCAVLCTVASLAAWLFPPPFLPLLGALVVFHSHHRQGRKLMHRLLTEVDQLGRRNLSLSSRVHNEQVLGQQSGDDILAKAS